jgi:hypothetical protein
MTASRTPSPDGYVRAKTAQAYKRDAEQTARSMRTASWLARVLADVLESEHGKRLPLREWLNLAEKMQRSGSGVLAMSEALRELVAEWLGPDDDPRDDRGPDAGEPDPPTGPSGAIPVSAGSGSVDSDRELAALFGLTYDGLTDRLI